MKAQGNSQGKMFLVMAEPDRWALANVDYTLEDEKNRSSEHIDTVPLISRTSQTCVHSVFDSLNLHLEYKKFPNTNYIF